jgi:hypothetical protein
LPTPPGPINVTSGASGRCRSSWRMVTSRSRPTKGVRNRGSGPVEARAGSVWTTLNDRLAPRSADIALDMSYPSGQKISLIVAMVSQPYLIANPELVFRHPVSAAMRVLAGGEPATHFRTCRARSSLPPRPGRAYQVSAVCNADPGTTPQHGRRRRSRLVRPEVGDRLFRLICWTSGLAASVANVASGSEGAHLVRPIASPRRRGHKRWPTRGGQEYSRVDIHARR